MYEGRWGGEDGETAGFHWVWRVSADGVPTG